MSVSLSVCLLVTKIFQKVIDRFESNFAAAATTAATDRCIVFTVVCSCVLHAIQLLTDEEKKQAEQMQKANPDMIYLNDINVVVSHIIA